MDGPTDQDNKKTDDQNPQIMDVTPPENFSGATSDEQKDSSKESPQVDTSLEVDSETVDDATSSEQIVSPTATPMEASVTPESPVNDSQSSVDTPSQNIQVNTNDSESESQPEETFKPDTQSNEAVEPVVPPPPTALEDGSEDDISSDKTGQTKDDTMTDKTNTASSVVDTASAVAMTKKKHVSVIPIIVALIIAVGLAVLTVYAYQKTKSGSTANSQNSIQLSNATNNTQAEPVTSTDVDEATKAANEALTASDDTSDIIADDLSDTSLGL